MYSSGVHGGTVLAGRGERIGTALVIGYGSIGARHARVLTGLGCSTAVVSARRVDFPRVYARLPEALACEQPGYVVIANSTDEHYSTLSALAGLGYSGIVLVEKPVFHRDMVVPANSFQRVVVGYNLRFHPIVRRLKTLLDGESVLSVHAYVGQYLPDWRPGTDYRQSYSAHTARGGGVLRDLSHELDYLTWLLGGWQRVAALGGHLSRLEIDSDDVFALLLATPRCPVVTLQLNYLDRHLRRTVIVNTARHTIEADLGRQTITVDRDYESMTSDREFTYRSMHESIVSGSTSIACSLDEGIETVRLIDAVNQAAQRGVWVDR